MTATCALSTTARRLVDAIERGEIADRDLQRVHDACRTWCARFRERDVPLTMAEPAAAPVPGAGPDGPNSILRAEPPSPQDLRAQREAEELFKRYAKFGPEAVDRAAAFGREFDELAAHGMRPGMPRERYVALGVQRYVERGAQ